ncbi:type VII secretion protein EssA [Staphylococcus epidermidis]|uniref:type VII secretion protein EssA n=2 Tax=Staphylococcus epidermidis TaxID=1282 RepID=UPI0011A52728|nr:type VII secretion protein EssA [Staphylococcus epidermidis]MBM0790486.1 type VII secretion protein EssA [Staphylococcus epidermidis]MCG1101053.1 type VII secretion protein EssA [Staphylococcus epidermidis]MCG1807765.1 type VII secretion protein EssA [Staphylococcus epidermidis]MCG2040813.1 type VII secretion protein EssA [Staphylococcus epidermidis]MCG2078729.1 type VII secretion protein EssA [Staphylococcus epidermidis]
MLIEGLMTMTLLTADSPRGSLDIQVDQEEKENVNKDLNQYDTTLFDKDSKKVNDALKKQREKKDNKIKNGMFQNQASKNTRLDETKKVLFSPTNAEKAVESDKSPYIQNKQEKNVVPYILLSIGAFLTVGFVIFSIRRGRKQK